MELQSVNKDRKKRTPIDMNTMVYGKVPPQAKELEEWVLGACMEEVEAMDSVIEILQPQCFYMEVHQIIFTTMISLRSKSVRCDIISVVQELKRIGKLEEVGGPFYVTKLTNAVVSTANIENHARIILQKFILREIIRISGEAIGDAYEDGTDCFELLDKTEAGLFGISASFLKKDFEVISSSVAKVVSRVDHLRASNDELTGVPSGFPSLDRITYGWQPTDLIILAARPAVGKTAFALNLARNSALHPTKPIPVGFFSLEMSTSQLTQRILAAESEVYLEKIARGKMDDAIYTQFMGKGVRKMETAPIYIDDTAAINIMQFRAKARRMVNKFKVGLIILDYLQLMSGTGDRGGNREQEISNISRNLKGLAKELNVPIIALSQLSRKVEERKPGNQMPQLSDLRESGAIEQDADMVMFIYRPEYYEVMNNEHGESTSGQTDIRIAKHRNGSLGTISLKADLGIQKFTDESALLSNWKQLPPRNTTDYSQANNFDDGFTNDQPF